MDALIIYDWPGNVRQLERLMERAVTLAETDIIALDDLPPDVRGDYADAILPSVKRNDTLRVWAGRYARLVLERCHGNKREACRVLGISYHTLQAHLRLPSSSGDETTLPVNDVNDAVDATELATNPLGCSESVEVDV